MLLRTLVDAGTPLDRMQSAVGTLAVEPVRLSAERVSRHGLAATRVEVQTSRSDVRMVLGDPVAVEAGAGEAGAPSCSRPTSTTWTRGCGREMMARAVGRSVGGLLTPILMKKGRPAHTLSELVLGAGCRWRRWPPCAG